MGTGKTAMALDWVNDALKKKDIGSALVVCPASLVDSWYEAIGDMIKFDGYTDADVCQSLMPLMYAMRETLEMEDLEQMRQIILERYNADDPITQFNRKNIVIL
jgi:SNF2 family DNA or RNA helicase